MVHHLISIWGTYKGLQMCIFITHTHMHVHNHTHMHTHKQACACLHTQACTQTYMHPFTHTDMHAHLHTWHIVAHRPQDSLQEIWVFLLFLASSYTTFASVSLVKPCTTFNFFLFFFFSFFLFFSRKQLTLDLAFWKTKTTTKNSSMYCVVLLQSTFLLTLFLANSYTTFASVLLVKPCSNFVVVVANNLCMT